MPKKPSSYKPNVQGPTVALRNGFTKPKSINELLSKKGILKQLTSAVSQQEAWHTWLASTLPEPLAAHINSVVARGNELVVFADSAAWSERLRYALAPLQARITERSPQIQQTRVRVQPRRN